MSADRAPKDNQVLLREWFDFATQRVPEMQEAKLREVRRFRRELYDIYSTADPSSNCVHKPLVVKSS